MDDPILGFAPHDYMPGAPSRRLEYFEMASDEVQRGWAARSSQLLGMAARVAKHELAHQMGRRVTRSAGRLEAKEIANRVKQARVIAESLSELKGAAMKAGQFLSIDASDFLPPEAVEVLGRLQHQAEPVSFETIRSVLVEELGADFSRLEGLVARPSAAASIGQVHSAHVDGKKVAVKVQYPGVAESIPSDIAIIRKLSTSLVTLSGRKVGLEGVFEELERILQLEADYRHEAASMKKYRSFLEADHRFIVPETFEELCSDRVLTMSWVEGKSLGRWIESDPPTAEREHVAKALLDLYCREFFDWGFVQTDPNPGNFLITDGGQIGLLDFGATLSFDEAFRAEYVELLGLMSGNNSDAIIGRGIEFGVLDEREGEEARLRFVEMMKAAAHPFSPDVQPFKFKDPDYQRASKEVVLGFIRALRFTAPPRRLLFLHRKLGGLFNILKSLGVELDLQPYWDKMVGEKMVGEKMVGHRARKGLS